MGESQRVRLSKAMLKGALLELTGEKGLASISVTELCKRAGINRSTFYAHYSNPRSVLEDIASEQLAQIGGALEEAKAEQGGSLSMQRRVEVICTYLRANRDVTACLMGSNDDVPRYALGVISLSRGKQESLDAMLAGYDPDTQRLLTTYLTHGTYNLIRQWLLEDIDKSPAELGELAAKVATSGWAS